MSAGSAPRACAAHVDAGSQHRRVGGSRVPRERP